MLVRRNYPEIKRDKVCASCGVAMARTTEHVDRCSKASVEDREFFVKNGRWPTDKKYRDHRDPNRLVGSQEDWISTAVALGDTGVRGNAFESRSRNGLIKRGLLEERSGRIYITPAGKKLWADIKNKRKR